MMAKSRGRCDSHESHRPLKLYGSKINHLQVVGIAFALSENSYGGYLRQNITSLLTVVKNIVIMSVT